MKNKRKKIRVLDFIKEAQVTEGCFWEMVDHFKIWNWFFRQESKDGKTLEDVFLSDKIDYLKKKIKNLPHYKVYGSSNYYPLKSKRYYGHKCC